MRNELPEQAISPPSEAWSLQEAARQSKISHLNDHLAETVAALEHIGEAQAIINYVDPDRQFMRALDLNHLWAIRGRLGTLRQHLRDELEDLGENPNE